MEPGTPSKPLTSAELGPRLLDLIDLGSDYRVKPETTSKHDDMAVVGCPALEQLGSGSADGSLDFPNQAKVSFTYASKDSDLSEEVYSDTDEKIASRSREIFTAMGSCPKYQMVSGSTPIEVTVQKVTAPQRGDEQWGHILTLTAAWTPQRDEADRRPLRQRAGRALRQPRPRRRPRGQGAGQGPEARRLTRSGHTEDTGPQRRISLGASALLTGRVGPVSATGRPLVRGRAGS